VDSFEYLTVKKTTAVRLKYLRQPYMWCMFQVIEGLAVLYLLPLSSLCQEALNVSMAVMFSIYSTAHTIPTKLLLPPWPLLY